jgi:hypothetical protein
MKQSESFFLERRQLLLGSAGLAVLATVPNKGLAWHASGSVDRMKSSVGFYDPKREHWRPVGFRRGATHRDQALKVIIRGPYPVGGQHSEPALGVSAIYHAVPQCPFELGRADNVAEHGGIVLHADADALAGLHVRRLDEPERIGTFCALTSWWSPVLDPGDYAMVIADTDQQIRSAWSVLDAPDESGMRSIQSVTNPTLAVSVISIRVTVA